MIKLYKAILRYSVQIRKSQEPGVRRNLSDCFTAITGHPLTELKASVEKERTDLGRWIKIGGHLHHQKEAENLLLKIDEVGESLKLLLENSSLMHLHVVEGALYDCRVHEHEDFCLSGTRTELLSHITDWANSDDKPIFWLSGMAGTGKTTIARTVAKEFKERGLLGASFFFKRGEADRGTATYLVTSIAGQLVTRHRQLVPDVLNAIKAEPMITSKFLKYQFDHLLYRPLLKLQPDQSITTVIVIDALDECDDDDDIKLILDLLFRLQEIQSVRLRVVLTSRPDHPILQGFQKEDNHQGLVLHEIPAPVIEHDIRLFLEEKLSVIQCEHSLPSDWPGNKQMEQLVQMAVPLFIFAATLCRFVGDEDWLPEERLTAVLQDEATESICAMDRTYLPVLNQLFAAKNKKEVEQLLQEFQNVIGVIVLLATPLSVVTLAQLTGITEKKIVNRLKRFHSVLSVPVDPRAPVRILHSSFRDFLIRTEGKFRINEKDTHRQIALNCLRVMRTRLGRNICDLASYGTEFQDIDPQIIQQRLPADLQYSCCYWVHHLKQSQGSISESEILSFLQKRFLHWLEALALMRKISEAARMIKTLESSIWVSLESL
jgi:ABC-type cobalt transport system substrate-binding protein